MIEKTEGGFLMSQIKQVGGRVFERMLSEAGVDEFNGAQGRILYVLWQEDEVPIAKISKSTGLAKTTLTSMLDRMEQSGLIIRSYDKKDRRQILISLTDKAESLRGEYNSISDKINSIYYKDFTDEEIIKFELGLRKILNNLTEEGSKQQ